MDGVEFRRGRIEDAAAVADVYLASMRATYDFPLAHSESEIRDWIRRELIPAEEVWLAVAPNQQVVAVMGVTDDMVDQLYVAPGWSGRGIGTRLLAIAMGRRPAGLDLWTFQVNARARRFYERHGFAEVERGDGSGNDEGQPDIRYAWRPAANDDLPTIRRSRRRLAERLEADRRAIERDLHDGVQQQLVAIAVNLQRLQRLVETDPASATTLLNETTAIVDGSLTEATELAQRIRPALLDVGGLAPAIRAAAGRAGASVFIDVPAPGSYPAEVAAIIYRSCEAVLSSASPGSEVAVRVVDAAGGVAIEVVIAGMLGDEALERIRDGIEAFDGWVRADPLSHERTLVHGWLPVST